MHAPTIRYQTATTTLMAKKDQNLQEVDEFLLIDWKRVLTGQAASSARDRPWSAALAWNDPSVAQVIRAILQSANWQVTIARNGSELLNTLTESSTPPDIFILDRQILPMRAHNLVADIRAKGLNRPVVILSATNEQILEIENYNAPQPFFVSMPFRIDYLVEMLVAALGQQVDNRQHLPHTRWQLATAFGLNKAQSTLYKINISANMSNPDNIPPTHFEQIKVWSSLQQIGFDPVTLNTTDIFLKNLTHNDILLSLAERIHGMTTKLQEAGHIKDTQRLWMNAVYLNSFMAPAISDLNICMPRYCKTMTQLIDCADPNQTRGQDVFLLMELFRCMPFFMFPVVDEFIDFVTCTPQFKDSAVLIAWCTLALGMDPWKGNPSHYSSDTEGTPFILAAEKRKALEKLLNGTNRH